MSWADLLAHWPSLATAGAGLGAGGLLKTWLDHRRIMRHQTDEVAMELVRQLSMRVTTVEASAAQERAICDARLAVLRSRVSDLSGSFDNLLLVAELAPGRVEEFAAGIRERRAARERAEVAEEEAVAAAALAAPGQPVQ